MKTYKFIFKFINHDERKCKVIVVEVFKDHIVEWNDTGNMDAYLAWMTKHAKFEENLKLKVIQTIKGAYPVLYDRSSDKVTDPISKAFKGYKLAKICMSKKGDIVNMSPDNSEVNVLRKVWWCEETKIKYTKGTRPAVWTDIFNYPHEVNNHYFKINRDGSNELNDIVLENTETKQFSPNTQTIGQTQAVQYNQPVHQNWSLDSIGRYLENLLSSPNASAPNQRQIAQDLQNKAAQAKAAIAQRLPQGLSQQVPQPVPQYVNQTAQPARLPVEQQGGAEFYKNKAHEYKQKANKYKTKYVNVKQMLNDF